MAQVARKTLKVLHTVAAAGLIGGLACYMILLVAAPKDTLAAHADMRQSILAISNYVLLPSLALGLFTGLLAMVVHQPFMDKGWVWIKAAMGILMFKGVLTIVSAKADHAADLSRRIAEGDAPADALQSLVALEWNTLWMVMAISVANVVLGIWRPRRVIGGAWPEERTWAPADPVPPREPVIQPVPTAPASAPEVKAKAAVRERVLEPAE